MSLVTMRFGFTTYKGTLGRRCRMGDRSRADIFSSGDVWINTSDDEPIGLATNTDLSTILAGTSEGNLTDANSNSLPVYDLSNGDLTDAEGDAISGGLYAIDASGNAAIAVTKITASDGTVGFLPSG